MKDSGKLKILKYKIKKVPLRTRVMKKESS